VYLKWYIDVYMYCIDVELRSFLMLAQNGVGGSLHALATLSQGRSVTFIHWIRRWLGPRAGLNAL